MRAVILVAVAACSFPNRSNELACNVDSECNDGRTCERGFCVVSTTDAGSGSDSGDSGAPFDCTVFNGRHFQGCDIPQPSAALDLSMPGVYRYDTDLKALVSPTNQTSSPANGTVSTGVVISIDKLTIAPGTTLRVVGKLPLVIASWSTIDVKGVIDIASTQTELGAGSNPTACATHPPGPPTPDPGGADGGGGGGFAAAGGASGGGNGAQTTSTGGTAVAAPLLLGGCNGVAGATGNAAGGNFGSGGGAIQLTAKDSITVSGTINASGGGGLGGTGNNDGGGGGGSGGMIGLESTAVTVSAGGIIAANGGGGGGGAGNSNTGGQPGQNGQPSATRATAGAGGPNGGAGGGQGGANTGANATGGNGQNSGQDGGGGGGGGVGFIVVAATMPATLTGGVVSPTATLIPR